MQNTLPMQSQILWTIFLVIGFPLLMLILGEVITRLNRRKRAIVRPLRSFRNLVLPTFALYAILSKVAGLEPTHAVVRIAQTAMWITIISTALSLLNTILFADSKPGSWQDKVPKLLVDLSRTFLVLIGVAFDMAQVWGTDLGGLLATLGVGSLVLGLALQDSLGNIFSGLAMLFEQPFSEGDWLEVGDYTGEVVQITWRSVHLATDAGDLVVVPNSELAQSSFKNTSRPFKSQEKTIEVAFSYDDPPKKVIQLLKQTALEIEGVLSDPGPWVRLLEYGDFSITYRVGLSARTAGQSVRVRNEFMARLWYVAKRHRLTMPYPTATQYEYTPLTPTLEEQLATVSSILREIPILASLKPQVIDDLVHAGQLLDYSGGEKIIQNGERLAGMYFLTEGEVQLFAPAISEEEPHERLLGQLSTGEFFGEKACLAFEQISDVTAVALKDAQVFMIDRKSLQQLLDRVPPLAQQIGEVMELRRRATEVSKAA